MFDWKILSFLCGKIIFSVSVLSSKDYSVKITNLLNYIRNNRNGLSGSECSVNKIILHVNNDKYVHICLLCMCICLSINILAYYKKIRHRNRNNHLDYRESEYRLSIRPAEVLAHMVMERRADILENLNLKETHE